MINTTTTILLKRSPFMGIFNMRTFGVLEDMEGKLQKKFNPTALKVTDPNGDLYKVNVYIVSDQFKGMMLLQRHRAINACIADEVKQLHAITIEAKTPDQV
jgi:BolA protein